MCFLFSSCAIVLLQKGAKVDDSTITKLQTEAKDWRQYHTTSSQQKLPVWTWIPTRTTKEDHGPEEVTFNVYEVGLCLKVGGLGLNPQLPTLGAGTQLLLSDKQ